MKLLSSSFALFALSTLNSFAEAARKPANAVLLSNVQTLTLRKDVKTTHRRVSAIPQLRCIGGNAKGLYEIDVMRCTNSGSSYDANNIEWTCKASLPDDFKLGSTDVVCEGYDSPDDPYILKGSCGVEYRLILTEKGEEKYGTNRGWFGGGGLKKHSHHYVNEEGDRLSYLGWLLGVMFWWLFVGVVIWMIYSIFIRNQENGNGNNNRPRPIHRGGGGGGGWGPGGDDPPPYDWRPPRPKPSYPSSQEGWRPGFWSGALGGAAAGYAAGSMAGNRAQQRYQQQQTELQIRFGGGTNAGASGINTSRQQDSNDSSSSTTRYESTGFGSTRRR